MIIPSLEELDSLKYSDLQNLAKSLGLRANLRATKLLKALKGYIKHEARKGNENQDESQTSASSCDETEIQISNQEEAERQPLGHVTKTRRRCKTVRVDPDSQNHEKQESQDLRATAKVPSPPDEHQEAENAVSSGNRDSKVPSEGKKSLYTDESSKPGKNKRTAITTPNFKKLHEAHFKEMESIDQYIERKKKHFEEHNSMNELKQQPINKGGVRTPVPPRGRLSVASTPISQRRSQGRSCGPASQSTLGLKGSLKRSAISAAKTGVRFSAATKDNEHKRSLTKTPARKSAHVTVSGGTPKGEAVLGTHKLKTITGNSAAVITPFKLTTEATQTPVSNKKPVFDLKASLSRPLNYEPHKGKLKPWGQSKENNYLNQHVNRINFYKKTYKQPHLQTKEEQRKKREQERKEKKAKVLGMRRGLILAED
ncbi:nucleolar and spindle associated protein 1 [Homo sapiens]|uniref:Isoform 6 of Nucleolar and spindle-associated protein 1 n=1 Tax=Homo sapiens TaxID=9606 RepID=Q9BXS6-6|nr:nucleolar and spindle-associated protein 1 isoform 5 [Homo sapiens]EAW92486.1 nucleolar and spindle associated protein 1, isoform CRA_e [Homo sapiens]KAI2573655.1 nucleolar and spindle associated protein 1 [Homo sapiens]KAI4057256.1 nucleolar and spindle associated protein 1 [Homo sapiens]|eukprot:NP_001230072.1 nucleolar and spindle-associated protein 1 isoform 5 [Homo sapiens]